METYLRLLSLSIGVSVRKLSNSSLLAIICQICFSIMGMIASRTAMAFCWVDKIFMLKIFSVFISMDTFWSKRIQWDPFRDLTYFTPQKSFWTPTLMEVLLTLTDGLCEDHLVWICDFSTFYWIFDLKNNLFSNMDYIIVFKNRFNG